MNLDQFTNRIAHDLRAPLRQIESFSQILREHLGNSDPSVNHYLQRILDGSERLQGMLEGLLTLTRVQRLDVRLETVSLTELLAEAKSAAEAVHGPAEWSISPSGEITADRALLKLALANLFDNAYKFRRADCALKIQVKQIGSVLLVEDNGIGIAPTHAEQIFDLFQTLHPKGEYAGTGSGLTVARAAVERMGGRIWPETKQPPGSVFLIQLPV